MTVLLGTESLIATRYTQSTVDREIITSEDSSWSFVGSLQPVPGDLTLYDEEGEELQGAHWLAVDSELYPELRTAEKDTVADTVVDSLGLKYRVVTLSNWTKGLLAHYTYILDRLTP